MRILITGAEGQVGSALVDRLRESATIVGVQRSTLDLSKVEAIPAAFDRIGPDIVINAAAYTAVDNAEAEPAIVRARECRRPGNNGALGRRTGHSTPSFFIGLCLRWCRPKAMVRERYPGPVVRIRPKQTRGRRASPCRARALSDHTNIVGVCVAGQQFHAQDRARRRQAHRAPRGRRPDRRTDLGSPDRRCGCRNARRRAGRFPPPGQRSKWSRELGGFRRDQLARLCQRDRERLAGARRPTRGGADHPDRDGGLADACAAPAEFSAKSRAIARNIRQSRRPIGAPPLRPSSTHLSAMAWMS